MNSAAGFELAETPTSIQILKKVRDTAREGVIVVDRQMRIAHCNVPAAVAFAREGLDLETKRLSEVIRDLDLHEAFRQVIGSQASMDVRLELRTAEKRKFDVHVSPIEL